ncbi:MAG: hypothetical protein IPO37_05320 [Saprospiraceae bacterium]|nr:hypothetical protein [Saprospiraceae bacterium]
MIIHASIVLSSSSSMGLSIVVNLSQTIAGCGITLNQICWSQYLTLQLRHSFFLPSFWVPLVINRPSP